MKYSPLLQQQRVVSKLLLYPMSTPSWNRLDSLRHVTWQSFRWMDFRVGRVGVSGTWGVFIFPRLKKTSIFLHLLMFSTQPNKPLTHQLHQNWTKNSLDQNVQKPNQKNMMSYFMAPGSDIFTRKEVKKYLRETDWHISPFWEPNILCKTFLEVKFLQHNFMYKIEKCTAFYLKKIITLTLYMGYVWV